MSYRYLNWAIQILGGNNDLPCYHAYPFSCIPEFESSSLGDSNAGMVKRQYKQGRHKKRKALRSMGIDLSRKALKGAGSLVCVNKSSRRLFFLFYVDTTGKGFNFTFFGQLVQCIADLTGFQTGSLFQPFDGDPIATSTDHGVNIV